MKGKRDFIERLKEFDNLSDAQKVAERIAWLERKMIEVIWLIVAITSMLAGGLVASIASDVVGNQSLWLKVSVFLFTLAVIGWRLQRDAFKGAPPTVELNL
jgi:uncharacterized membrane protein